MHPPLHRVAHGPPGAASLAAAALQRRSHDRRATGPGPRRALQALRWLITQVNNLTDKSLLGEVGEGKLEAILTLLAVALTLYWSFTEFAASAER